MLFLKKNNLLIYLFLISILCLPAVFSLFHAGFFPSHDGEWMVIRLTDFHRSFVSGQIPVRWAARLNYQYGYPVFNFLYPLPFYFGEFFHILGFSFVNSIKAVFVISFFLSAIFMYLWIKEEFGSCAGLISAVIYTYTPYRFLDVYVRGSLGESLAFIFFPLIFYSLKMLEKTGKSKFLAFGGLSFAGLITSHNTMAMLFTFVFLGYLIFYWLIFKKKIIFLRGLIILFLGLIISCFFWLPALYEIKYVFFKKINVTNFFNHFPTLNQLLISRWGYGPSLPSSNKDTLSFQVGLLNLAIFLAVFGLIIKKFLIIKRKKEFIKVNFLSIYFLLVFLFSFFMMTKFSFWIWRFSSIHKLIQFPWRLLSLTTLSNAVLGGTLIRLMEGKKKKIIGFLLIILSIIINYKYARPEYFIDRGEDYYIFNEATTTVANEYLPIWVKDIPKEKPLEKVEVISGNGEITNLTFNSKRISFEIDAIEKSEIQINIVYYPGWEFKVDGKKALLNYENEKGVMRFWIEKGNHKIIGEFRETPIRKFADGITIFGLIISGIIVIRKRN